MERMPIYVLMQDKTPLAAYTDQAVAEADCWTCNTADYYTDGYESGVAPDYWVKSLDLMVFTTPSPAPA